MTRYFVVALADDEGKLWVPRSRVVSSLAAAMFAAERMSAESGVYYPVYELREVICLCDAIGVPFTPTCELHYGTWEDRIAAEPLAEMRETEWGTIAFFVGTDATVESVVHAEMTGQRAAILDRWPTITNEHFAVAERLAHPKRLS